MVQVYLFVLQNTGWEENKLHKVMSIPQITFSSFEKSIFPKEYLLFQLLLLKPITLSN